MKNINKLEVIVFSLFVMAISSMLGVVLTIWHYAAYGASRPVYLPATQYQKMIDFIDLSFLSHRVFFGCFCFGLGFVFCFLVLYHFINRKEKI
jgi:uncharacterized membrane protein YfhO